MVDLEGSRSQVEAFEDVPGFEVVAAALGADHILAQEGTLTGSIGVILQTAEFSQLAEKLGITPVTIKSGPNKSVPSPFEKMDEAQRQTIESVVQDFYRFFAELVAKRRKLPEDQVAQITDGRIFTGRQALESKLIDAIGGEREAVEWLHKNHKIPLQTRIRDAKPRKEVGDVLDQIQQFADETLFSRLLQRLDGLVLIWQPESI